MIKKILPMLSLVLLTACVNPQTQMDTCTSDHNNLVLSSKDLINTLIEKDYDSAIEYNYDETISALIESGLFKDELTRNFEELGDFKELGVAICGSDENYDVVAFPMKFKNKNVNVNIVYNKDGAIAGVNLSDYTGQ